MKMFKTHIQKLASYFHLFAGTVLAMALLCVPSAYADFVGETQTAKVLDQATVNMIQARLQLGQQGIQVGDNIGYFITFAPYPGTVVEMVGGGAYTTDYIPAGTQVVEASFANINPDGSFTAVPPPTPAEVLNVMLGEYSETGIFFSSDARTQMYTSPSSTVITATNGYTDPLGAKDIHNWWDYDETVAIGTANPNTATTCATNNPWTVGGKIVPSPVAGPDALITNDARGVLGPWQRISYSGSTIGTNTGITGPLGGCLGGTPTTAGYSLSPGNPLPATVNAVRFAAGHVTVGTQFAAHITLHINSALPATGLINNSEVFGGDVSELLTGAFASKSTVWKYLYPSIANANTNLSVTKKILSYCTGATCTTATPTMIPYSGTTIPAGSANTRVRYEISYVNSGGSTQTNVVLQDTLSSFPAGQTWALPATPYFNIVSGSNIATPTPTMVGGAFSFGTIASLSSGAGGTVDFDVLLVAAPTNAEAIVNTIKMTTTSMPGGVIAAATTTAENNASLSVNKTTTNPTVTALAPTNIASYSINIPNSGSATANTIIVTDYLPITGAGGSAATQFTYLAASGITATQTTAAGVQTAVAAPTSIVTNTVVGGVGTDGLYNGYQKLVITFPVGSTVPIGGYWTVNFSATVGSSIPASTTPYSNNAYVKYNGGQFAGEITSALGQAPVTVQVPLSLSKSIDCVYLGATCVAYTSGAPISTGSKIRYRLTYANTSSSAIAGVTLTDTLPANVTFGVGTATEINTPASTPPLLPQGIVPPVVTGVPATGQLLTFGTIASLPANTSGAVTFEATLGGAITSGMYITNNALLVSTLYTAGVAASLTSHILNMANLVITKSTSTPTLAVNGTATYTITVTNTGGVAAAAVKLYDWLPFYSAAANINTRFNYAATGAFVLTNISGTSTLAAPPAPTPTIGAANIAPYNVNLNQQQILWTFTAAQILNPGDSFTLTFTAIAGAAGGIPAGSTIYYNNAEASYTSGVAGTSLVATTTNQAPITVPDNLTLTKTINCVYSGAVCNAYNGSGLIPVNAKVRYQVHYANTGAVGQTGVFLCDALPTQTTGGTFAAGYSIPGVAPTPVGAYTNTPAIGAATTPANAACTGMAGVLSFSFNIGNLAGNSSGDVYYDVALTDVATNVVTNTSKIVSATAPVGETAAVSATVQNVPNIVISKTTATGPQSPGGSGTYTITITNTGGLATTSLDVYDFLPYSYSATPPDPNKQFVFTGSSGFGGALTTATFLTASTPPTIAPYSSNANQQMVHWSWAAGLAAGASGTITFNANIGNTIAAPATYTNGVMAAYTSTAGSGNTNANGLAPITVAAPTPSLTFLKTVNIYSDPVNGVADATHFPKFIPGAVAYYTLTATNFGTGPVDTSTLALCNPITTAPLGGTIATCPLAIIDPIPSNTLLYVNDLGVGGSGPVAFTAGVSTLIYTKATDLSFSNDNAVTWAAVPVADAAGCDATVPAITHIRVNPKGSFVGGGASFNLIFRVCVK